MSVYAHLWTALCSLIPVATGASYSTNGRTEAPLEARFYWSTGNAANHFVSGLWKISLP